MILKPQDIVVLLKLVAIREEEWSYSRLAYDLAMSPSEVHAGIKRALAAKLAIKSEIVPVRPVKRALEEFLIHGVKYVFPPDLGGITRGMPTSYAAPPLSEKISQSEELPPVWPDPEGEMRGYEFSPLYKSVPEAARRDQHLYELLALVDAIRGGRVRERQLAVKELKKRLEMLS